MDKNAREIDANIRLSQFVTVSYITSLTALTQPTWHFLISIFVSAVQTASLAIEIANEKWMKNLKRAKSLVQSLNCVGGLQLAQHIVFDMIPPNLDLKNAIIQ